MMMQKNEELRFTTVRRYLLVPLTVGLLLLIFGFGFVLVSTLQSSMEEANRKVLETASNAFAESLSKQTLLLSGLEDVLVREKTLRMALKARDRERLLAAYGDLFVRLRETHGITHFSFHRADRVNLLRLHKPEKHDDLIGNFTLREAERTGKTVGGIELGSLGTFTLRSVRPVFEGDTLIGYLELGREIEDTLAVIHTREEIETVVSIHKNSLVRSRWKAGMKMLGRESNWDRFSNDVVIYSSLSPFPTECDPFVAESGHIHYSVTGAATFNGKSWRVLVSPITDVSGTDVGDLFILVDVSEAVAIATGTLWVLSVGVRHCWPC
ncbi:MAG: hypothetical protein GY765_02215 [bacterium]|nr:hypothetical protein [bacterium]